MVLYRELGKRVETTCGELTNNYYLCQINICSINFKCERFNFYGHLT